VTYFTFILRLGPTAPQMWRRPFSIFPWPARPKRLTAFPVPVVANLQAEAKHLASMATSTDSAEQRARAARQRDEGLLNPGDSDYERKMRELWGGPNPKWFDRAVVSYRSSYGPSALGRTALVTGANGGIGFYVAKALAAIGFEVVLPARPGLEAETVGARTAIQSSVPHAKLLVPDVSLDLCSLTSTRSFAAAICSLLSCLDVLCLNAGRGGGQDDPREVTGDGHEAIMQVNVLSHFLLVHELMPLLRASAAARVVSQTSGARFSARKEKVKDLDGTNTSQFSAWDQYCLSKAANVLFTRALNERLKAHGVSHIMACVSDPGLSSTGVNIQHDLTKSIGQMSINTNQLHDRAGHHAADGALPMVLACVDPAARRDSWFTTDGVSAKSLSGVAHAQDPAASQRHSMDPLLDASWPRDLCESFWTQCSEWTCTDFAALLAKDAKL